MYLEVHIDSHEAQVFLIEGEDIVIGSLPENEIVIDVESVSKKHLKIVRENKSWYATDIGSTNGTYIDSERLIPGQRKEIFANQYLRLGDTVHVALVKSPQHTNEAPKPIAKPILPSTPTRLPDDKTRVISLQELKEAKAIPRALAAKREEEAAKVPKKEKKERAISNKAIFTSIVILIIGYFLNDYFMGGGAPDNALTEKASEIVKKNTSAADKVTE